MAKLSKEQIEKVRRLHLDGLSFRALATRFGVSRQAISRAIEGTKPGQLVATWREVHERGDTRKPWNVGKRTGKWLAHDAEATKRRFRRGRASLIREYVEAGIVEPDHPECVRYLREGA